MMSPFLDYSDFCRNDAFFTKFIEYYATNMHFHYDDHAKNDDWCDGLKLAIIHISYEQNRRSFLSKC